MKTAKKTRPKILKHRSVASKKAMKRGLNNAALTLEWICLTNGDTTSEIYRIGLQTVKKRRKRNKRRKALIGKIGWILFAVLADFFVHYFLTKLLS